MCADLMCCEMQLPLFVPAKVW